MATIYLSILAPTDKRRKSFWSRVVKEPNGCWIWTGACSKGYGQFSIRGKHIYAHRFSWLLAHSEIPNGMSVLHTCDNPACVNSEHLWLGTHNDNMADMVRKGRQATGRRGGWHSYSESPPSGEQNGNAKLCREEVVEIRGLYADGGHSMQELGDEYGVSKHQIFLIVRNRSWIE